MTQIIYIDDIDKKEAKRRIIEFFDKNDGDFYVYQLSEKLHIDYELAWEVIKELEEEGKIEAGED